MRGRKRIIGLVALLSVVLVVSAVFASGIMDFSKLSLLSVPSTESASSTANVFVDPSKIIKDYLKDTGYQKGNKFTWHVNISLVSDLFTWQINLTWNKNPTLNKAILNVSRFIASEFLARSPNSTSSEVLGSVISVTDNAKGSAASAETILGNIAGQSTPPVGRLVTIEFLIVGYGSVDLTISLTGTLKTTMLNSTGGTITFTKTDGVFRNKLKGDVDMNGAVVYADFLAFRASWQKVTGQTGYNREADTDLSGVVDYTDFLAFRSNWQKVVAV